MAAGVSSRAGIRMSAHCWVSTLTPNQTFGSGHGPVWTHGGTPVIGAQLVSSDRIRACRLVRIW